jgi:hypothetical protein
MLLPATHSQVEDNQKSRRSTALPPTYDPPQTKWNSPVVSITFSEWIRPAFEKRIKTIELD